MRCRRCREPAVIEIRRHNVAYCKDRFLDEDRTEVTTCRRCNQPTTGTYCAFCRARAQVTGERIEAPGDLQVAAESADEVMPAEIYDQVPSS